MQTNALKQVAARAVVAFLAFVGASTLAVQSSFAEAVPPNALHGPFICRADQREYAEVYYRDCIKMMSQTGRTKEYCGTQRELNWLKLGCDEDGHPKR